MLAGRFWNQPENVKNRMDPEYTDRSFDVCRCKERRKCCEGKIISKTNLRQMQGH